MEPPGRHILKLPELGMGQVPVVASLWLVEPGERVVEGDRVLEVHCEAATVDLAAPVTGRLREPLVDEGERLVVGQQLAVFEAEDPHPTS